MKKTSIIILIMLPIIIALVCLCIGRIGISPGEVIKALTGSEEIKGTVRITIINVRLPRILLGLLCGAGLAVAGCSFQSFFSNP